MVSLNVKQPFPAFRMIPLLLFTPALPVTVFAFQLVCGFVILSLTYAVAVTASTSRRRWFDSTVFLLFVSLYLIAIDQLVWSGWIQSSFIPNGPIFFITTILFPILIGFTNLGRRIATGVPLVYLVGFHGFRLPLELVLHQWFFSKTIPETMTWSGSNFDILTGAVSIIAALVAGKSKAILWFANLIGIVLLINVIRVAILSSPVPFGWHVEPPLELINYRIYAFIVPVCVGGAALGHVILTRALLAKENAIFSSIITEQS